MATTILCPVDFSPASSAALQFADAIARHFGATLTVLTVNDALLAEAAAMQAGAARVREETIGELQRFAAGALGPPQRAPRPRFEVRTGQPAPEILRTSAALAADLIVMSSHGLTGFRKMFFGSTTERVLRETAVPVLVVPGGAPGPAALEEAAARVRRVLIPVLIPAPDTRAIAAGRAVSAALGVPAILLHVVEPVRTQMPRAETLLAGIERERRARAEAELARLTGDDVSRDEALIAYGEPAEEIVKVARDRRAGLIVIGLQGSALPGARIGSVTYRVLCAAPCLVLAVPARPVTPSRAAGGREKSRTSRKTLRGGSRRAPRSARIAEQNLESRHGTPLALMSADTRSLNQLVDSERIRS